MLPMRYRSLLGVNTIRFTYSAFRLVQILVFVKYADSTLEYGFSLLVF